MATWCKLVLLAGGVAFSAGCATREPPLDTLPPSAAGPDYLTDDSDAAFYVEGPWSESSSSGGYVGTGYHVIPRGTGANYAVWNNEQVENYELFARWPAHANRASNAKYTVHHINDAGALTTETVTVNQRQNGGQWVSLGTYRMSNLTGRVTLSDDANGYVVADAVRFVPLSAKVTDSDGDGLSDQYELSHGLDPDDPTDADRGPGAGPTTGPQEQGSSVELPVADVPGTAEEQTADRTGTTVTLNWTLPSSRENGEPLSDNEIAYYEIQYSPVLTSEPVQVDDESNYFQLYGGNLRQSAHTRGYVGSGYYPLPPGNGEILAEWAIYDLVPGATYRLEANWTSDRNRASSAVYRLNYVDTTDSVRQESVEVDQTQNGGNWNELGTITTGDSSLIVEAPNVPGGYVIADAVRAVRIAGSDAEAVRVEDPDQTRLVVDGLSEGAWQFRVRTVDTSGIQGRFSDPVTYEAR